MEIGEVDMELVSIIIGIILFIAILMIEHRLSKGNKLLEEIRDILKK